VGIRPAVAVYERIAEAARGLMSTRVYTPPTGMQAAFPRYPLPELGERRPWTAASEGASRGTTMHHGPLPGWRLFPLTSASRLQFK
jgi:hypothetical protein